MRGKIHEEGWGNKQVEAGQIRRESWGTVKKGKCHWWKLERKNRKAKETWGHSAHEEENYVCTKGGRMESKKRELEGQRIQDDQQQARTTARAWQSKGGRDAGCGPEESAPKSIWPYWLLCHGTSQGHWLNGQARQRSIVLRPRKLQWKAVRAALAQINDQILFLFNPIYRVHFSSLRGRKQGCE